MVYTFLIVGLIALSFFINLFFSQKNKQASSAANHSIENKRPLNDDGKKIFQTHCANCPAINKQKITGPAMADVEKRGPWGDRKKLFEFMRNVGGTISRYAYTKKLVRQFNGQVMPSYPTLSDKELTELFDYIAKSSNSVSLPVASK